MQITGDLVTGDVYIAGMDEGGGGFPHNDTNYFFRSTDGGNTWTNTYIGPTSAALAVAVAATLPPCIRSRLLAIRGLGRAGRL